jgi:anaerobic ribonucleoside-triphosphate reductase activating protein
MVVKIDKLAEKNLSKNLIGDYKAFSMVDGEGIRCAIFVSGCIFNCKGCYNKSIQDFSNGRPYTMELEDQIIKDISHDGVQGLTLLGGEPFLNADVCLSLIKRFRKAFGSTRDIWAWTGYTYEELLESIECDTINSRKQKEMLDEIDVLVDGRFVESLLDTTGQLTFRGSWNQRIIDVRKTEAAGEVVVMHNYIN